MVSCHEKKVEKFCTLMPIGTIIYLMKNEKKTFETKRYLGKGGFIYTNQKIMENLAKVLPLSQTFRPDWDRETLPTLGYHNIVTISTSIPLYIPKRANTICKQT